MANKPKIQTMKDDLIEMEGKLAGESENKKRYNNSISESQNETPAKIKEPEILSTKKDATIQPLEIEDSEVVKLKNIISRISQTTEEKEPAREPNKKENMQNAGEKVGKFPVEKPISDIGSNLEKTVSAVEAIVKKPISAIKPKTDRENVFNKEEIEKKSFWKSILENFKKRGNAKRTKEADKVRETSEAKETSEEDKIIKIEKGDKSGILKPLSEKIEETSEKARKKIEEKEYVAPENRLTLKKQEYYSSVRKKIKPKEQEQEEDMKYLAKTVEQKQKILSKSEEYKKLKQKIIKKYHVRISSLPWKKIIVFSSFAIAIIGASYFLILSYFTPPPPPPPPPVIEANELAIFDSIKEKAEITEDTISSLGYLETITSYLDNQKKVEVSKLVIINNEQDKKMPTFREALGLIKINADNLPENLLKTTSNSYNFFVFKTKQETYRLGIAVKINNTAETKEIMSGWEQETNKDRMMAKAFKGLFLDDPLPKKENFIKPFNSTVYKNINIRYIHLPDKDIALNYFIYNDMLVITTSKDSSFLMADFMVNSPKTN